MKENQPLMIYMVLVMGLIVCVDCAYALLTEYGALVSSSEALCALKTITVVVPVVFTPIYVVEVIKHLRKSHH